MNGGDPKSGDGRRPARREVALALACCALGAGLALLAAGRGWVSVAVDRPSPLPPVRLTESGRVVEPLVPALGVVGLAGVVGLLASRRAGRAVLGGLLAAAGLAVLVRAVPHLAAPSRQVAMDLLSDHGPTVGVDQAARVSGRAHPVWPLLAALGGVGMAVAGLLAAVRGRNWPSMSSRYDSPGPARDPVTAAPTNAELWDALDSGQDPTEPS